MAGIMERFGNRNYGSMVSFLIVAETEVSEQFSEGLRVIASQRKYHIAVHVCKRVTQVLKSNLNLRVDFIIFVYDTRLRQSLFMLEKNINELNERYIISGCACLVNATSKPTMTFHNLMEICNKYNLRFMSADISAPQSCISLGNRIMNLAEAVLGLKSGLPMMDSLCRYE